MNWGEINGDICEMTLSSDDELRFEIFLLSVFNDDFITHNLFLPCLHTLLLIITAFLITGNVRKNY